MKILSIILTIDLTVLTVSVVISLLRKRQGRINRKLRKEIYYKLCKIIKQLKRTV